MKSIEKEEEPYLRHNGSLRNNVNAMQNYSINLKLFEKPYQKCFQFYIFSSFISFGNNIEFFNINRT